MKVMVVDDETGVQRLLETLLQEMGYEQVVTADSALSAFQVLKSENVDSPDGDKIGLIFMDINMPGVDGIEACRLIRNDLRLDVPVIMVTAAADAEHVAKAIDAGATDYIRKPIDHRLLETKVQAAISDTRKTA